MCSVGDRVHVLRYQEWVPGVVTASDDEIDITLDRPDASGATKVWTFGGSARLRLEITDGLTD